MGIKEFLPHRTAVRKRYQFMYLKCYKCLLAFTFSNYFKFVNIILLLILYYATKSHNIIEYTIIQSDCLNFSLKAVA